MSQGDSSIDVSVSQERTGTEQRLALQPLIRDGRSFSGRERHCCFLNLGGRTFANVSSVSGLDFADDGRAAASVDWDQDGDLDLWVANRNGPQVRFLRNDVPNNYHYVTVLLEGRGCNRDAIGARLELTLAGDSRPLMKTLRAGDGYLSQSSKRVHFGLGPATRVERLVVRWPGGAAEEFRGLAVDRRYRIVQGSGRAELAAGPSRELTLKPSELSAPRESNDASVFLSSPVPLPRLDYLSADGQPVSVSRQDDRPVLLNLWASWCAPCVEELREFTRRRDELGRAGLDLLALNVDELGNQAASDPRSAPELLATLGFPFTAGRATAGLLDKLQIIHEQLFDRFVVLPLPTSILINRKGELAALYRGPVNLDILLADVAKLSLDNQQMRVASQEFPGRWMIGEARISLIPVFRELVQSGYREDAFEYVARNHVRFPPEIASADVMTHDGNRLLQQNDLESAEQRFRQALSRDPRHVDAIVKLGVVLDRTNRRGQAERQYREALEINAENVTAQFALALLLTSTDRSAEAIDHFREVARIRPDYVPALYQLAAILATDENPGNRDGQQAVQWAEKAAQATNHQNPEILDVLAAAYAEAGRFEDAKSVAQRAIELGEDRGQADLVSRIRQKMSLYEARQPYHSKTASADNAQESRQSDNQ